MLNFRVHQLENVAVSMRHIAALLTHCMYSYLLQTSLA